MTRIGFSCNFSPSHTSPLRALTQLRQEVNNQAAVLGFVGSPWTLATYIIEGGSSSLYKNIKVGRRGGLGGCLGLVVKRTSVALWGAFSLLGYPGACLPGIDAA